MRSPMRPHWCTSRRPTSSRWACSCRRGELLQRAASRGTVVLEDDYDTEFRFGGRPLEPLQAMDSDHRVLYVGSFSKTLLPTLRLGFVVVPASLRWAMRTAKMVTDWHSSGPMQDAVAEFLATGDYDRHLRRMRRMYEQRHHRVLTTIDEQYAELLRPIRSLAGLHIAAMLPARIDDRAVAAAARERGVELSPPLSAFGLDGPADPGVIIGYGAIETDRIEPALAALAAAVEQTTSGP